MWHELTRKARESGALVLLGVIQEQHADRCRLFAQWQEFDWPILHDPMNLLGVRAVPIFVAIDEGGIVVDANFRTGELDAFLTREKEVSAQGSQPAAAAPLPALQALEKIAGNTNSAADWRTLADHRVLWGGATQLNSAIDEYGRAHQLQPDDGGILFRLGVAHRMRHDSPLALEGDFQSAVDAWGKALAVDPNHYIYRRRIQQYGPRLIKPYPFYDWVEQARTEIKQRGEIPVELAVEPGGAEIAQPAKNFTPSADLVDEPDPEGRILRDAQKLIQISAVVVPGTISPGDSVRVHVELQPRKLVHWNNEAEPLEFWLDLPEQWQAEKRLLHTPQPLTPESQETRRLEFELQTPSALQTTSVKAYALYYVCEEIGGQCLYRRQDIEFPIVVEQRASP